MAGDCSYFIAQAKALGVSDAQILEFKQYNTNADGSWDCHRLLDAFGGQREQSLGQVSSAQVQAAASLPPPVIPATTSGDPRMFLTLSNVPDASGSAAPARSLAAVASSPIGMGGLFGGSSSGGLNLTTLLIIAAIVGAGWYLMKGRR